MARENPVNRGGAVMAMIFMWLDSIGCRMMRTDRVYGIADGNMSVGYMAVMRVDVKYGLIFRFDTGSGGTISMEVGGILCKTKCCFRSW